MLLDTVKNNLKQFAKAFKQQKQLDESIPKYLQLKYTFVVILLIVVFAFYNLDTLVENYVKHSLSSNISGFFSQITDYGKGIVILTTCGLILLGRLFLNSNNVSERIIVFCNKLTAYAFFIVATSAISGLLGQILKMIIGRARPKFFLEYGSHYFQHFHSPGYDFASMPSGHSISVGAIYMAFILITPKIFRPLWVFIIVILASSRIFVGSHYPSDVIFGVSFGCYTSAYIYYWLRNRKLL